MGTVLKTEHSLKDREQNLSYETTVLGTIVYLELTAGCLILLYGLRGYVTAGNTGWLITGGLILFLAAGHYFKTRKNRDAIDNISTGRSGESFVSGLLRENLPDNYYILNDVEVSAGSTTAQIDHVIVSEAALVLVETKAYAGRLSGSAGDDYWTQSKTDETTQVTNPIRQSRYHREVFEKFLSRRAVPFDGADLHWYVAMVNKECDWSINGDTSMVDYAWNITDRIQTKTTTNNYSNPAIRALLKELNVSVPDELF